MNELQLNVDDAASEHSEIEKMLEEDHQLIKETESIISDLTDRHKDFHVELENQVAREHGIAPPQTATPPLAAPAETMSFGTMFTGGRGSIFGNTAAAPSSKSALPPLHQNVATETTTAGSPSKAKSVSVAAKGEEEWISSSNLKQKTKSAKTKKSKMEAVPQSTNTSSKVAVITVDVVMQKAMCEMGLRVLTTRPDRQMQGDGNQPVQTLFRCYGCFTVEHDTNRTHCRQCGGMTFQRMSVYLDERGRTHERYSSRDRFNRRYLEKNHLVPRGTQLVRYNQQNGPYGHRRGKGRKGRREKRQFVGQQNGYRGGGGQRW